MSNSGRRQPVGRIANPPFSVDKEAGYAFGYNPPYGLPARRSLVRASMSTGGFFGRVMPRFTAAGRSRRAQSTTKSICSMRSLMVGCTSEYLDDIVRNPLGEARRDRSSHGGLRLQPSGVSDNVFDADEVEKRKCHLRFNIDEHIDVAVGPIVSTNPRTKDRKFRNALGFDGFGISSNCCDNLIACH